MHRPMIRLVFSSRACSLLLASLALGVDPILDLTADCIDIANVRNPWLREAHRFSSLSSFKLVVCEIGAMGTLACRLFCMSPEILISF